MRNRVLAVLLGTAFLAVPVFAQQTVTGKITNESGEPIAGAQIQVKGTLARTVSTAGGAYSVRAERGQVLQFRHLGTAPVERTVGDDAEISVTLRRVATSLDEIVVTALGQSTSQRALGTSQQSVIGADIAQTKRENFINALQGRVAGVEVTSSSGVPGASTQITIRGVSSISGSNQPLMIVDGLPLDNKTLNTGVLASDAPGSLSAFSNRGVDFSNRASDLNPDDIETLVVLKGPEASALYGIDAANGAIVITTKRGIAGAPTMEYSSSLRMETTGARPELQKTYGPTSVAGGTLSLFQYFGAPYAAGTTFYDNIDGFFRTAVTQKHSLAFSGAATDSRINYRLAVNSDNVQGVVPGSALGKINLTGRSQASVNRWIQADLSMAYTYQNNDQVYKGTDGPLIGLMLWPQTDDAKDWLSPAGTRRRLTALTASGETDNPYFNVNKNKINATTNRLVTNAGLSLTPVSFAVLKTNIGVDGYTNGNSVLRHPESAYGNTFNGVLDQATDQTRNVTAQTVLSFNARALTKDLSIDGLAGHAVADYKSSTEALKGQDFLDPNFVSINNTSSRTNRTTISQRRLQSAFASARLNWRDWLYVTLQGRNDWTSTIPIERNSFRYPSVTSSFIFTDAFKGLQKYLSSGKLRAGYARVGKDARPYAFRPSLEYKTTSYGGYGYGFTGPNLGLKPEFAVSFEAGTELGFFKDRMALDVTWYRKKTRDQIVNDIRGSYGTGFILFNLNGAETQNEGLEATLRGTPMIRGAFSWDAVVNFEHSYGKVKKLPNDLPESYVSDTWLFGNVRNGTKKGLSTRSLTGLFYLRNTAGDVLIDPTTGLPLRSTTFIDYGYDRQPDFTMGVSNTFRYKRASLDFLVDLRKGGDVYNATEQFLTARGLSTRTLDREQPRIIKGVLRDGKENSATPTKNTIVVIPAVQPAFYTAISEELFIEKDINWLRLKDVTFRYNVPGKYLRSREASVFITGTDLFLMTNYSGLDPIVNGNTAAVGGSNAAGIDYGNFPVPRAFTFGVRLAY